MMITPENQVPPDDYDPTDADDQQSQQDLHSNGLDDTVEPSDDDKSSDADLLKQASEASEPSFTLDVEKGIAPPREKDQANTKEANE